MTRRNEDFDELCDPDNPRIIKYDDVVEAATLIRPHIMHIPCMASHCQQEFTISIYYKMEMWQKSGSYKERGMLNALQKMPVDKKKLGIVIASLGNEAYALCSYSIKQGIPVIVVMPINTPISRIQKCHSLGAKVLVQGGSIFDSQRIARAVARDKGLTYINSRDHPDVLAGHGTVALEILQELPFVDAVLVPVGSGGLAAAVATVIKHDKPECQVYGVNTEAMPVFFKSLEQGESVPIPIATSIADSIAVPAVGVNAFNTAMPLLDKMLMVKEDWIARAILHLLEKEHIIVEGAGACPLAAIIGNLVPEFKVKTVVCILSGGNVDLIPFTRSLERGLSAEGRLVKFSINIKDTTAAQTQLLRLLANGGYSLTHQFQNHRWLEDEQYRLNMDIVCRAKTLEHALELKRVIERAYPDQVQFATAPFNDKRTCPCYVWKSMTF